MGEDLSFNEKYRRRTKQFAIAIIHLYTKHCKKTEELRVVGKQMLRSGTSVAANFRAYTRGRSAAERFSKMCIVVEETDETQFWLEILEESGLVEKSELTVLQQEATELISVFTTVKSRLK